MAISQISVNTGNTIGKVVVIDGNNLIVRIDRGVAGRSVTDVAPVEIDGSLYLVFSFSDGTTETVGPVGTVQYIGQSPIVVSGSTISLSTVPINLGGTGQVTANAGFNALAPTQTGNSGKYLKTDGTNSAWDLLDISTSDITGVLPLTNGGTGSSTASGARTNLGLGTIATQNASSVAITGGSITGITDLAVADGGTGASTAAGARTNLNAVDQALTLTAGTGLSGGGDLTANRSFSITNTGVTAAAYGAASKTLTATVNAQGQLTVLADTPIAITNTQISGLGTMSTQNANAVAITGGSITGITDLAVADGGTGASDASGARINLGAAASATTISAGTGLSGGGDLSANRTLSIANTTVTAGAFGSASNTITATVNAQGQLTSLAATPIAIANTQVSGLGTMSTQNSNAVTITGGSITGITDLAIADGGTGASNATDARSNLGLGSAAVLNAGVALGVATLDAGGTVPLSQIPASIQGGVSYQGSWNASTNTPTLTSSVGSKGYYYVVSTAGSTNLNGITDWLVGDWAIFNGSVWQKIDNTDQVASVNGYTGVVVLSNTDVGAPPTSLTISAGTGLSGGGSLAANRTLSIANTTVTAAPYGSASAVPTFTVNGQGQLTTASNTTIAIANTQVSGLGTMSTQNANSVAITGGSITGITDLAIADGGTGASTAADARTNLGVTATGADTTYLFRANNLSDVASAATSRTNLGLGTIATQNANSVAITGGTISNLFSALPVLSGGTGVTTSSGANSVVLRDADSNITVNSVFEGYSSVAATGTTTVLTAASIPSYVVTGSGGQTFQLPNATTLPLGALFTFNNNQSSGAITVNNASSTLVVSIPSGGYTTVTLLANGTSAGTWDRHDQTPANVSWSTNTFDYSGSITSATWNGATVAINRGGTGQTTANAAFNALAPSQTGQSGKYLTTDGSNTSWATNPLGTVTSVSGTGTVSGISLSGTVTTSGNLTLGGTLDLSAYNGAGAFTTLSASGRFEESADIRFMNEGFGIVNAANSARIMTFNNASITTSVGLAVTGAISATTPIATTSGGTGLSSFTSGGVVYASSSSALATGSVLSFDGNKLLTNALAFNYYTGAYTVDGTISNYASGNSLYVNGNAAGYLVLQGAGNQKQQIGISGSNTGGEIFFTSNGSESMRLTSTGLGIGTSNPTRRLSVETTNTASQEITNIFANSLSNSNYVDVLIGKAATTDRTGIIRFQNGTGANDSSMQLGLYGQSPLALTISYAGNLGLGYTPSASYANSKNIQMQYALLNSDQQNGHANLTCNAYESGNTIWSYVTANPATRYQQTIGGVHAWHTSTGTPTVGGTISFTQAMTLDASGALGIGNTSPSSYDRLVISNSSTSTGTGLVGGNGITLQNTNSTNGNYTTIQNRNSGGGQNAQIQFINVDHTYQGAIAFTTRASVGDYAERARIDSSGNLLVGTTSTSTTTEGARIQNYGGGFYNFSLADAGATNSDTRYLLYSTGASAYRFYVGMGGTIFATSIVISAISDQRLKENVRDIDTGLDAIMALQPRRFDWKDGKGQDKKNVAGFIAQEFENVFPECVGLSKAGADGIEYKNINHETLIPTLVKAIQEQQAIIESLKARLDAANL
jgi:hypothetical protein